MRWRAVLPASSAAGGAQCGGRRTRLVSSGALSAAATGPSSSADLLPLSPGPLRPLVPLRAQQGGPEAPQGGLCWKKATPGRVGHHEGHPADGRRHPGAPPGPGGGAALLTRVRVASWGKHQSRLHGLSVPHKEASTEPPAGHDIWSVMVAALLFGVSGGQGPAGGDPDPKQWLWERGRPLATTGGGRSSPLGLVGAPVLCARWGLCQSGLLWGQGHPLPPAASARDVSSLPAPSAPSTATRPAARSRTCCARPWASPPRPWTAPSGPPPAAPSLSPGWGVARLLGPVQAWSSPSQAGWGGPLP